MAGSTNISVRWKSPQKSIIESLRFLLITPSLEDYKSLLHLDAFRLVHPDLMNNDAAKREHDCEGQTCIPTRTA